MIERATPPPARHTSEVGKHWLLTGQRGEHSPLVRRAVTHSATAIAEEHGAESSVPRGAARMSDPSSS